MPMKPVVLESIEALVLGSRPCSMPKGAPAKYEARVKAEGKILSIYGFGAPPARGESIVLDRMEAEGIDGVKRTWLQAFGS